MDPNFLVSVLLRWMHIGAAVVLIGGLTTLRFVVTPVLAGRTQELEAIRLRWKKFVHAGIGLFILSGGINYWTAMPSHKGDGLYHALIGTKILLALVAFFFASALVGRSSGTQKFRNQAAKWSGVVLLLGALIIAMSGEVKVRDNQKLRALAVPPAATSPAEGTTTAE